MKLTFYYPSNKIKTVLLLKSRSNEIILTSMETNKCQSELKSEIRLNKINSIPNFDEMITKHKRNEIIIYHR